MYRFPLMVAFLIIAGAASSTDEAPRATFAGTLNHNASKRAYSLTIPVTTKVGDTQVKVSAYDLPLVLPEGTDLEATEKLVGQTITVQGFIFGEPRQLLAVELIRGATEATRERARPKAERKADDYLPKEVKEEKKVAEEKK